VAMTVGPGTPSPRWWRIWIGQRAARRSARYGPLATHPSTRVVRASEEVTEPPSASFDQLLLRAAHHRPPVGASEIH